jgi:hypothetical protein
MPAVTSPMFGITVVAMVLVVPSNTETRPLDIVKDTVNAHTWLVYATGACCC